MDITTIAGLLKEFVLAETEILNNQDIRQPITIGTMFEGLTETILNKSIFGGLNLRVIKNSFIVGCDTEFDIMLVEGDGEKTPLYGQKVRAGASEQRGVLQAADHALSMLRPVGTNNIQPFPTNAE